MNTTLAGIILLLGGIIDIHFEGEMGIIAFWLGFFFVLCGVSDENGKE